ncbi:MAG TPA: sugar ABC transporter permease [Clostridiaceae bacterium]|nr:sugar ABC transporter permease [Clostridiaceae bacterium]
MHLSNLRRKYGPWMPLYSFLIIPVVYVIVFRYIPMLGAQLAFRRYSILGGIWNSRWVGFENFEMFFNSYQFNRVLSNTLRLSLYLIFAGFPFPVIFALLLNTIRARRFKRVVQTVTYMPHFISTTVLVGIMLQFFNVNYGIYGKLYTALVGARAPDLFSSGTGFVNLYIWSGIWQDFGWGSIMYLAALTNVNPELHEAAQLDGASRFQCMLHIDIPAIIPIITIMLVLRAGSVMNIGFEKVFLMQNDLNIAASEVISTYEYKRGFVVSSGIGSTTDVSLSTTIGLFNSTINLLVLVVVNFVAGKLGETSLW